MFGLFTKKEKPFQVQTDSKPDKGELEKHSPTWLYVETWANENIEKLRIKNDSSNNNETQTAMIRGQIRALKNVLDMGDEKRGILNRE